MSVNYFWVLLLFHAQKQRESWYMEKQMVLVFQIIDDRYTLDLDTAADVTVQ